MPVSIFRVRPNGTRETFSSGIVNPTSMALDAEGQLYVSSRFEGTVYRAARRMDAAEIFATDLGVACGLAFDGDGTLFVGDRSGTIFRSIAHGQATAFASLPSSVAAFHLALGAGRRAVRHGADARAVRRRLPHRRGRNGHDVATPAFGRPQGLAFDRDGACTSSRRSPASSGLYRLSPADGEPELVLAVPAWSASPSVPEGELVVCSNDTAYRLTPSG